MGRRGKDPCVECPYPAGSYAAERWQPDLEAQARWGALEAMRAARWAAKRAKIKVWEFAGALVQGETPIGNMARAGLAAARDFLFLGRSRCCCGQRANPEPRRPSRDCRVSTLRRSEHLLGDGRRIGGRKRDRCVPDLCGSRPQARHTDRSARRGPGRSARNLGASLLHCGGSAQDLQSGAGRIGDQAL
jgi:hypothetical protein